MTSGRSVSCVEIILSGQRAHRKTNKECIIASDVFIASDDDCVGGFTDVCDTDF